MLRTGRLNQRSMEGPIRLPENRKEMLKQVEEMYLVQDLAKHAGS